MRDGRVVTDRLTAERHEAKADVSAWRGVDAEVNP